MNSTTSTFVSREDLPAPRLWRTDTKALVGSILLAVAFAANMQIAERVDTATMGGIIPWTGTMFARIWFTASAIFYGLSGALIVASFNPIIAVLTSTGPLAPAHFLTNWSFCIPFALISHAILKRRSGLGLATFMTITVGCALISGLNLISIWLLIWKFNAPQTFGLYLWYVGMSIPGSFLAFQFIRGVARSGVIR